MRVVQRRVGVARVLRMIVRQVLHRRARSAALVLGVVVASVGFALLTTAVRSSQLRVTGTVGQHFDTSAYDVLVRPHGPRSALEQRESLVPDGFSSGLYGGITMAQLASIRGIGGVAVAAPVENLGYVLPSVYVSLPVTSVLTDDPVQLFRVRVDVLTDDRLSTIPGGAQYVYYSRQDKMVRDDQDELIELDHGHRLPVCHGFNSDNSVDDTEPFSLARRSGLQCFSALSPGVGRSSSGSSVVGVDYLWQFPMLLAAVDPVAEAKLVGLDKAVTAGRYLRPTDAVTTARANGLPIDTIPVLASTRSYDSEQLKVTIERLQPPAGTDVPAKLASTGARAFLNGLAGTPASVRTVTAQQPYQQLLTDYSGAARLRVGDFTSYWQAGPATYLGGSGSGTLTAAPTVNPPATWRSDFFGEDGTLLPPPASGDTAFRRLTEVRGSNTTAGKFPTPTVRIVGRFDSSGLTGFDPLTAVPLTTYVPPKVTAGDAATAKLLGNKPLEPNGNLAGYVAQPPLMLTTLAAAKPLLDRHTYPNADAAAPISYIRVKVAGVTGPDKASLARIKAVAQAIGQDTGLDVDITVGSSPRPTTVSLAAGRYGRPALTVNENWVKKGVAVAFIKAVNVKSLAVFVLVLVVCVLFLLNAALAAVRHRRTELGVLSCLGWSRPALFRLVESELLTVGTVAGLVGAGLTAGLSSLLDLHVPGWQALAVIPVGAGLTGLAGLWPAWRAATATPLQAVIAAPHKGHRAGGAGSIAALARSNVRAHATRSLLATTALALAVASLTTLAALASNFQTVLHGTLLGATVTSRVRPVDLAASGLLLLLGAGAVADVTYLAIRERAAEFAVLRANGWADGHVRRLLTLEGAFIGLAGSLIGAAVGLAVAVAALGTPFVASLPAAVAAAAVGELAALAATLGPLAKLARVAPAMGVSL